MNNETTTENLRTREQWDAIHKGRRLPVVATPQFDVELALQTYIESPFSEKTFLEVGCAPGGWMAWFARMDWRVMGIDYSDEGARSTRRNMEALGIAAHVITGDALCRDWGPHRFTCVFSAGFIEHFTDTAFVVRKLCAVSSRYVVTLVPNMYGLNGLKTRWLFPAAWREHVRLDRRAMIELHEDAGLRTLFCEPVGGLTVNFPCGGWPFFKRHRLLYRLAMAPFSVWNRGTEAVLSGLCATPRMPLLSPSVLYIGER